MIIDGHVHIGTSVFFHMQADADLLLRLADKAGFDRIFVTELTALFYDMSEGNDALAAKIAPHGDRMIGYASIPTPRLGRRAIDEVRRSKADIIGVVFNEVRIGRQGIGTPFYHYYQYEYESSEAGASGRGGQAPVKPSPKSRAQGDA
jgi:predicted TIM-barrel fold metal-dependent hydrolase